MGCIDTEVNKENNIDKRNQFLTSNVRIAEKWPLMDPNEIVFVVLTYLISTLKLIPNAMEVRSPPPMKGLLIFFNGIKVLSSSFLACEFLSHVVENGLFPKGCETDELPLLVTVILYWKFMANKVLDMLDTLFIAVRKKHSQMTFLHVYHRVFMVITTWVCLKYDPSYHWCLIALIDCAISTVASAYYCIAALGSRFRKHLWWKKYLVMMQLMEFFLLIVVMTLRTSFSECPLHISSYWMGFLYLVLFFSFLNERTKGDCTRLTCFKQ